MEDLQPWLSGGALLAIVIVSISVLRSLGHGAAMGRPARPLDDVLDKVVTDRNRIQNLKDALRDHLDATDRSTQWTDANYVPLQAQVQMLEGRTSRPKIVDLLKALRGDQRTRVFIVLGEPGSGKSVAMRKLARDLLRESGRRDRIPIYINLKEWAADRRWTPASPPTNTTSISSSARIS